MKRRTLAAVVGAAAALAGCGNGPDSISKQEYVQRVKERCRAYNLEHQHAQAAVSADALTSAENLRSSAVTIVAVNDTTRKVVADLRAIPAPRPGAVRVQSYFAAADEAVAAMNATDAAAREGNIKEFKRASREVGAAFARGNEAAPGLGFGTCA